MIIKSQADFCAGVMFTVFGIVFGVGAVSYSMGSPARPGPGYFPLILSIVMSVLGVIVLIRSLSVTTADGEPLGPIAWRPLLVVVASIVLFGAALLPLGLLLTIPLLIFTVSLADGDFGWKGALLTSAVLTFGSWLVFIVGLGLAIPLKPAFMGV